MTVKLMKATDEENLESFKEKKKKRHIYTDGNKNTSYQRLLSRNTGQNTVK